MTRTVKLADDSRVRISESESLVLVELDRPYAYLCPRDIGRLIAALARTKAALADRTRKRAA